MYPDITSILAGECSEKEDILPVDFDLLLERYV